MTDSVLQKYTTRKPEDTGEAGLEADDDLGAFGWLRGLRERAVMLELRQKDGNIVAIGYAYIEKMEFDPSQGISLHALGKVIKIQGRNLNTEVRPNVRLFQGLTRHRVPWVQAADEPARLDASPVGTVIERIVV